MAAGTGGWTLRDHARIDFDAKTCGQRSSIRLNLRAYAMTDTPESFHNGAAAYRNARE